MKYRHKFTSFGIGRGNDVGPQVRNRASTGPSQVLIGFYRGVTWVALQIRVPFRVLFIRVLYYFLGPKKGPKFKKLLTF